LKSGRPAAILANMLGARNAFGDRVAAVLLACVVLPAAAAALAQGPKCAVFDLSARAADAAVSEGLTDVLVAQVHRTGACGSVISRSDVAALLGLERRRQLLGCDPSQSSCLAEIGGALGVDRLVTGSVGRVGSSIVLRLDLLDVRRARVLQRASRTAPDADTLLASLPEAVAELMAPPDASAGAVRIASRVAAGLGVASLVAAGVLGWMSRSTLSQDVVTTGDGVRRHTLTLAQAQGADREALAADVLFACAGAFAAGALVLHFVAPSPGGSGASVALAGRF